MDFNPKREEGMKDKKLEVGKKYYFVSAFGNASIVEILTEPVNNKVVGKNHTFDGRMEEYSIHQFRNEVTI